MNKEFFQMMLKSPFCQAILIFLLAICVLREVVVPIVHVVTDTIPTSMQAILVEVRELKHSCLAEKLASRKGVQYGQ